jgi:hypothetical protein
VSTIGTVPERSSAAPAPERDRGMTIDRVWMLLPLLLPVLMSLTSRMVAIDLAYQVRAGDLLLRTAHIPSVDSFTFTISGKPWFDQQWGAQLLLALFYRAGGWATVSFFRAVLIGAAFSFIYMACRARGASPSRASALTLLGFLVSLQALAMRPQLFAITLFAASLWVLATWRDHPRRIWLIPAFAVAWANLHGSFVLCPLLVALAWLDAMIRRDGRAARGLVPVGLATLLATFITPFGPLDWRYAYQLTTNPVVRNNVTEWAPVTVRSFGGAAFFASAIAVAAYLARRRQQTAWGDIIWLATFFVLALPAVRGIVWWGLIAPVILAAYVEPLEPGKLEPAQRSGSRSLNRIVVGALVFAILVALPWWRGGSSAMLSQAPAGLSAAVGRTLPAGTRVFVSEPWASWFEQAEPAYPVFTDPRIEIFPTSVWADYTELRDGGSTWESILDKWQVQAVVVDRKDFPRMLAVMQASPEWKAVYQDPDGVLFVRSQP